MMMSLLDHPIELVLEVIHVNQIVFLMVQSLMYLNKHACLVMIHTLDRGKPSARGLPSHNMIVQHLPSQPMTLCHLPLHGLSINSWK